MLRRATKLACLGAAAGGTYLSFQHNDLKHLAVCRVSRSMFTVGGIVADYKTSLSRVEETAPNYSEIRHGFHQRSAERLLKLCCENGGCYIKVGQHVAALEFLLPEEYITTLKVLHANAPQSSLESVKRVLSEELGRPYEEVFDDFDEKPIGCASLAQVHKAKLRNGDTVAVKVQHNNVYRNSFTDMTVMEGLGRLVDKLFPEFSLLWLVDETKINLPKELDFVNEANNCDKVRGLLKSLPWVRVPRIRRDLTTKRVLVMDYEDGGFVNDKEYLIRNKISPITVAQRLGKLYSEMIFVNGFVHCDPHPGNILVDSQGDLILLDHGLYSQLSDRFRLQYTNMWLALIRRDIPAVERIAVEMEVPAYLTKILASILTGRRWKSIEVGEIAKSNTDAEAKEIKAWASEHVDLINAVLQKVPREMLLLFKTNDLIRGIESSLGVSRMAKSFVTMSQCCVRAVYGEKLKNSGRVSRVTLNFAKWLSLLKISVQQWFLWMTVVVSDRFRL
ncbi:uncharacterized aarF domain-containing protein kinase 1 [Galendromus occidentalis]|uniref:Uncharacterized aarF domain-containing protein kinase 1 n=1 Tax=Galendromus occidentalis TaxID=34638 RepID=A0AAJ7PAU6_9ACAR|nr:uncharacterized aarF domain-containing protein kinase 1 [Galendromus occidentalis]XP_018496919.1 uncharacterized aarF domain-containing protein kinase 1 [Galendromus occidentalis]